MIEREDATGGIPRHSDHLGYGVRDLRRFVSGPAYARRLTETARDAGARLHTRAQVTGWAGDRRLLVTSPRGRHVVEADAVVLATGARERPRPARWIAGDRPDGVYTTGQLQNLVHLEHAPVGRRAVVVGAELVSWSAVLTLREAGCRTVAMTSAPRPRRGLPRLPRRRQARAAHPGAPADPGRAHRRPGPGRVGAARARRSPAYDARSSCDTVVTTGDWVPDHELVRLGRARPRPGHPRPARRHLSPHLRCRRLRRRQPRAPGGHRRRRGPRRASRRDRRPRPPRRSAAGLRAGPDHRRRTVPLGDARSSSRSASRRPGATCSCGATATSACLSSGPSRTDGSWPASGSCGPQHPAGCSGSRPIWWRPLPRTAAPWCSSSSRIRADRRAGSVAGALLPHNCLLAGGVRGPLRWYGRCCNRCRFQQV